MKKHEMPNVRHVNAGSDEWIKVHRNKATQTGDSDGDVLSFWLKALGLVIALYLGYQLLLLLLALLEMVAGIFIGLLILQFIFINND